MGRNPSGCAGTGQAKMGSRAGGGGAAAPRSGSAAAAAGSCSQVQARLLVPAFLLFTFGPTLQTEITEAAPRPPEPFATGQNRVPKLGAENKNGNGRALPAPFPHPALDASYQAAVNVRIRGSLSVVNYTLQKTPLQIAPQQW